MFQISHSWNSNAFFKDTSFHSRVCWTLILRQRIASTTKIIAVELILHHRSSVSLVRLKLWTFKNSVSTVNNTSINKFNFSLGEGSICEFQDECGGKSTLWDCKKRFYNDGVLPLSSWWNKELKICPAVSSKEKTQTDFMKGI